MAKQTINLGAAPDDGTGDSLRVGGDKINDNFDELYAKTINNDDWSGTDLAIVNGGTGASSAGAARTNLDVYSKGEVDAAIGGGGAPAALDDLTDVDTTGVADGDVLTYDSGGNEWLPVAPSGSGVQYFAIPIQPTASTVVNVNSTTYLALIPLNFYLDRDTFQATHFRIVIRGSANAAGQTITAQMAVATAPTVGLHTGGNDLVISDGATTTYDSGWLTLDDGGTGLLFGTIALKGSNSTVDLTINNAAIMFKR